MVSHDIATFLMSNNQYKIKYGHWYWMNFISPGWKLLSGVMIQMNKWITI